MARLRYNGLATGAADSTVSLTLGGSLTNSATSVTFSAALTHSNGTAVPTITGTDYIPLAILDANGHLSEVVWLTAYTAAATSGTIARGKEGTSGVAHSSGDKVVQAAFTRDVGLVGCKAVLSTSAALTSGTARTIPLDGTDVWDTDSIHDPVTNNTRLTVPAGCGGVWEVNLAAQFTSNATGYRMLLLYVNGVAQDERSGVSANAVSTTYLNLTTAVLLAAGDYVELGALANTTGISVTSASLIGELSS